MATLALPLFLGGDIVAFWIPLGVFFSLTYGLVIGVPLLVSIYGVTALIVAVLVIGITIYGFVNHASTKGQVLAVFGLVLWVLLGAYGLGHGG